jgi:hypothetical protein
MTRHVCPDCGGHFVFAIHDGGYQFDPEYGPYDTIRERILCADCLVDMVEIPDPEPDPADEIVGF